MSIELLKGASLSLLILVYPVMGYTQDDPMRAAGMEGQQYAQEAMDAFNSAVNGSTSERIQIPNLDNGTFTYSDENSVNVEDMFPQAYESQIDIQQLQSLSNDPDGLTQLSNTRKTELWNQSQSENTQLMGSVYNVLVDYGNMSRPDVSNDPVFSTTLSVVENIETLAEEFGDCTTRTVLDDISSIVHVPDYRSCDRVVDRSTTCSATHSYDAGVISHYSGPYNISQGDDDSLNVWIGQIGDNYWSGWCSIYENETAFIVDNPQAITSVTLDYVTWDDHIQILIGPQGNENIVYQAPYENQFPPETEEGQCELRTSWERSPNLDITELFMQSIDQGDVVRFRIRVSVSGRGEGYARLRINYNPELAIRQDVWAPQECIDAAQGLYDGVASGTASCTRMPTSAVDGCVVINNVQVCNDDLNPAPFEDVQPLCEQVTVDVDYDFYQGPFCYTDTSGQEHCVDSGTTPNQACNELESDPQCGYIRQECLLQVENGTCYLHEEIWDCGTDVTIPDTDISTEIDCQGPVRCMGADCIDPTNTQSTSFNRAMTSLHAAQFMTMDMECVEADGTANVTCEVFSGEPFECKVAVGGASDCCDVPTNVNPQSYFQTLLQLGTMTTSLFGLETGDTVMGAYHEVRDEAVSGVSSVLKPFTSYSDNIAGLAVTLVENYYTQVFVEWLKDRIQEAIREMMQELLSSAAESMAAEAAQAAAADAATQAVQDQAQGQLTSAIGSAVSVIGAVYTAYVVAMMVIQAVYACEEPEFMLASKNEVGSCHRIGSYCASDSVVGCIERRTAYCCYNSPLSRIINEQIQNQTGDDNPWGTPEDPICGGLDIGEVAQVDWTQVDLGEWTALLAQHNVLPDASEMDLDSITGAGNVLNRLSEDDENRQNAADRLLNRVGNSDIFEIRHELQEIMVTDPSGPNNN